MAQDQHVWGQHVWGQHAGGQHAGGQHVLRQHAEGQQRDLNNDTSVAMSFHVAGLC